MSATQPVGSEVLYSMPVAGTTKTTTTASVISANAAGNPPYQLRPLAQIFGSEDRLPGRGLLFLAGGTYDAGAVTSTLGIYYDSTQATQGTQIAGTGAVTVQSLTTGGWSMYLLATCVSVGINTSGWVTNGWVSYGAANNAGTAAATTVMMGGAQSAGVPTNLALATEASIGYIELWSTWGTAPTAFVCSSFMILGLN